MRLSYAIVFVSNMSQSVRFYRDIVGIPLKYETPEWSEFATDGATFALHAAKGASATEANSKGPGQCRPGFTVPDLTAFHQRMVGANVPCTQTPRDEFGVKLAQYSDPDGLEFSVSEERGGH